MNQLTIVTEEQVDSARLSIKLTKFLGETVPADIAQVAAARPIPERPGLFAAQLGTAG
jgi:hypothetical protein